MDNEYDPLVAQLEEGFTRAVGVLQRNAHIIDGIVKSVDYPDAFTCTVTIGDGDDAADVSPVILKVLSTTQASIVLVPTVGTACTILFRDGHQGRPQLLECHEADKILLTSDQIIANGGDNDGMVNIVPAVAMWKTLVDDLNRLKTAFNSWVVVPDDGGAALKAAAAGWSGNPLDEPDRSQLEDTTFTH